MLRTVRISNPHWLSKIVPVSNRPRFFSVRVDKPGGSLEEEEEQKAARAWLASFKPSTIPRNSYEVSFSRSSGPGGQHVNKTSSKATLRLDLTKASSFIPDILIEHLKGSRYYALRSESLVFQSDESRRQANNVENCQNKLHDLILTAGKAAVRGESSPGQIAKVKNLQKLENEARLRSKKTHSNKKNARRGSNSTSY